MASSGRILRCRLLGGRRLGQGGFGLRFEDAHVDEGLGVGSHVVDASDDRPL
ncbi:hypothetical protein ACFTXJ_14140 [Streptomyces zhihengii]|uniref:hypothetical protein n=1 Tax=Streptomyces zhihengii TaxID=1818004 RepID=UPI0036394F2F